MTGRNTFSCYNFYFSKRQRSSSLITTSVMPFNSRCQPPTRQTPEWKQGLFRPETLESHCSRQRNVSFSLYRPTIKKQLVLDQYLLICWSHLPLDQEHEFNFGRDPEKCWCHPIEGSGAQMLITTQLCSPLSGKKGAHVHTFAALGLFF